MFVILLEEPRGLLRLDDLVDEVEWRAWRDGGEGGAQHQGEARREQEEGRRRGGGHHDTKI